MLGIAAVQCFSVAEQLVHGIWTVISTGYDLPLLTAGTGMLRLFVALTTLSALGGFLAYRHLRVHSWAEERMVLFGMSRRRRLLAAFHTDRAGATGIISARLPTRHERGEY